MKFPPHIRQTDVIKDLVYEIDLLRTAYELHPVSDERARHIQRVTLLKSSLFSARIEGNPLELHEISRDMDGNSAHTREVSNLVRAYEHIPDLVTHDVTIELLTDFHNLVMSDLAWDAGTLRTEESAIFTMAGIAVYLSPAPSRVRPLLTELCAYANGREHSPLIVAALVHVWFEKIHPFVDGNGRVGRLLSALLLTKHAYGFSGLVPIEEYLDTHRDMYYGALQKDTQDVTKFVEFFLTALYEQAKISLAEANKPATLDPYERLLPRRAEIVRIIADHMLVSFDMLARRFPTVPSRTLHYDISQLIKDGYVLKKGSTRGVVYGVKKN